MLPALLTLLLLAVAWSGAPSTSSGSHSLVPAWFKPLIHGGWSGSYAGEGDASSFLRESEIGSGGVTCAQVRSTARARGAGRVVGEPVWAPDPHGMGQCGPTRPPATVACASVAASSPTAA